MHRGWIGPYVVTKRISDLAYELQIHPTAHSRTVHIDYLKKCFAWAKHDNWIINPNYKLPAGRPRLDPTGDSDGLQDLLEDAGATCIPPGPPPSTQVAHTKPVTPAALRHTGVVPCQARRSTSAKKCS